MEGQSAGTPNARTCGVCFASPPTSPCRLIQNVRLHLTDSMLFARAAWSQTHWKHRGVEAEGPACVACPASAQSTEASDEVDQCTCRVGFTRLIEASSGVSCDGDECGRYPLIAEPGVTYKDCDGKATGDECPQLCNKEYGFVNVVGVDNGAIPATFVMICLGDDPDTAVDEAGMFETEPISILCKDVSPPTLVDGGCTQPPNALRTSAGESFAVIDIAEMSKVVLRYVSFSCSAPFFN